MTNVGLFLLLLVGLFVSLGFAAVSRVICRFWIESLGAQLRFFGSGMPGYLEAQLRLLPPAVVPSSLRRLLTASNVAWLLGVAFALALFVCSAR